MVSLRLVKGRFRPGSRGSSCPAGGGADPIAVAQWLETVAGRVNRWGLMGSGKQQSSEGEGLLGN